MKCPGCCNEVTDEQFKDGTATADGDGNHWHTVCLTDLGLQ